MSAISSRKEEHVKAAMGAAADYVKGAGFGDVEFLHCALPELDLGKIDTRMKFLGHAFSAPLAIEGMTGGYPNAKAINERLAAAAEEHNVMFGVGSQRAMLKQPELANTFRVRNVAPHVFLVGNIGAVQLAEYKPAVIEKMVKDIDADALAIHLNPLQEAVQPEGERNFAGCLSKIAEVCDALDVPVIAKETGAGISASVAKKLKKAGVAAINVSGSGGTSWSRVEYVRWKRGEGILGAGAKEATDGVVAGFEDWGIPTVESVAQCSGILPTIASGGIRSGIDAAKAIALGAQMAGAAKPFLMAENTATKIAGWKAQLATTMFLTGCKDVAALGRAPLVITGRTAHALEAMGIPASSYFKR
jgi:isopentenyl-diphosphate Delta-isomerase